jgi:ATP-dependent RNA helicase MSS116
MFAALRRCPATLARSLSSAGFSSRVTRSALPTLSSALYRTTPRIPTVATAAFHQTAKWRQYQAAAAVEEYTDDHVDQGGPCTRFADLATRGLVHPNVVNTITKQMKLETMTPVQTQTINEALSGVDM